MNPIRTARSLYYNSPSGRLLLHPVRHIFRQLKFNFWTDRSWIRKKFRETNDCDINLKQPSSFNEKILWLSLYERDPQKKNYVDKIKVREHITNTIGNEYLIPLLHVTNNARNLDPSKIKQDSFVIKTNHDSGTVFIVRDKHHYDYSKIKDQLSKALNQNYYYATREWQYHNITPNILVESLITDTKGQLPKDFKFHCFNGQPLYIQVDSDRFTDHTRLFYDHQWKEQPFSMCYPKSAPIQKPEKLEEMIEISKELSKIFTYVRVDLYQLENQVYFGELTFTPDAGFGSFNPIEWDKKLGKLLNVN